MRFTHLHPNLTDIKTLSVYLIDDDEDDRAIFCEVLSQICKSINCIAFASAEEALQNLESTTTLPDFIFLDLNIPRLNGRQCLQKIKERKELADIPVVIYSTSKLTQDIDETKTLGADYYITKPSNLDKLKEELQFVFQKNWKG